MRLRFRRSLERALVIGFSLLLPVFVLVKIYRSLGYAPDFVLSHPYFHYDLDSLEPRLSAPQSCVLPRVHPFHPSVWGYLPEPRGPVSCRNRWPDITLVDRTGSLRFNETQLAAAGHVVSGSLRCTWSDVIRGGKEGESDETVEYGPEVPLDVKGVILTSDFVRVRCRNFAGLLVHDVIHAHIRDVQEVKESVPQAKPDEKRNRLNVLIFGVDSMSRLSFIRQLPRSYKYLTEELRMRVFRGMNKVADNTFPNLIAILTGQEAYGGRLPSEENGFDDWPLIWNNFSSAGYATLWAEDFPKFGLFNYLAKGFLRGDPTLHCLRRFWLALRESPLARASSAMCYGRWPRHQLQLDYVRRFIRKYSSVDRPYFGFSFLAEVSHEYISTVSAADQDFEEFFRFLRDGGHLEDTLFIVMSDHGHRFDAIRSTQVGHIEERLPFFAIHVPEKLNSKFPHMEQQMKANEGRLVTPFDTYATLVDLLDHVTKGTPLGAPRHHDDSLGVSLFSAVPANRTCSDASIPENFCVCETEEDLPLADFRAGAAAGAVLEHLNQLLEEGGGTEGRCALLGLGQLKNAYLVRTPEDKEGSLLTKVRVVIETRPGGGLFEAAVRVDAQQTTVLGDVSRINPYQGQSDCIQHAILRKFCYCVEQNAKRTSYNSSAV